MSNDRFLHQKSTGVGLCLMPMLLCSAMVLILHGNRAAGDEQVVTSNSGNRVAESLLQWANDDPAAAVVSRVRAQAELMQFQRNRMKGLKASDDIITMQLQIDEHDMRQIRNLRYANSQRWRNNRAWERLKNNPDLNEASVRSGRALNFLLARLAVTALPYRFDAEDTRYSSGVLSELKVEADVFESLTLQQRSISFPATAMAGSAIAFWPYILRWNDFSKQRAAYEQARTRVVEEAEQQGEAPVEAIQSMQQSLKRLNDAFKKADHVRSWAIAEGRTLQFGQCQDFFRDLDREMKRLEETGDLRPFQSRDTYNPQEDGDHLINLLSFMNRNGIRFARAKPGSEFAHHRLFSLMRALYLTVEEFDESTRVQSIGDQARELFDREAKGSPQKERLIQPD